MSHFTLPNARQTRPRSVPYMLTVSYKDNLPHRLHMLERSRNAKKDRHGLSRMMQDLSVTNDSTEGKGSELNLSNLEQITCFQIWFDWYGPHACKLLIFDSMSLT